ncbi:MAG: DUF3108 domain-containing protein [Thermodesulfobacteriota bacterium]
MKRFMNIKGLAAAAALVLMAAVLAVGADAPTAAAGGAALGPGPKAPTVADAFVGEELVYRIGFWIFDDIAEGKVSLAEDPDGGYVATLEAQTTGFVGFLMRHRKDTYVARLRLSEDGKRFITKTFEKTVDKNGRVRRGITTLDYEKGLLTWKSWGGGKDERSDAIQLPGGVYFDDPLAAFYNFRYGAYGPVGEGREYRILTFPKREDHLPEIYVRVATRREMEKKVKQEKPYADYLAEARIDKELFGQQKGDIEILFTGGMTPVYAVARDVAMFGDVRGKLTQISARMDLKKTASGAAAQ